jgi:hypothetical protein
MRPFPDVREEPTTWVIQTAEAAECPACGADAYQKEVPGDMIHYYCRECGAGTHEMMRHSNYGRDWDEVREWVLERDGRECKECGKADEELHIHHIEKLVHHETTDEAHRPGNLITLCEPCHRELEREPKYLKTTLL